MRPRRIVALCVLAGLLPILSGCLQGSPRACPSGGCANESAPGDLVLPKTRFESVQFLNCTEAFLTFDVATPLVDPLIPDAFEPVGLIPGTTALRVVAQDCPRVVASNQTLGATLLYWTFAYVHPVNASWGERGYLDWYLFDYAATAPEVVAVLKSLGVQAASASIQKQDLPLPAEGRVVEWQVKGSGFSSSFHYRTHADQPQRLGATFHLWFGETEFHRVNNQMSYHVDTVFAAGEFVTMGESRFGKALPAPATVWQGTTYDDFTAVWQFDPRTYG